MSEHCGNCGCGSNNDCGGSNLEAEELEKLLEAKNKNSRKYTVKYRIKLDKLGCEAEELLDRIKAYVGIVDELEFTEEEVIISYDDRLITPAEISDLVQ